MSEPWPLPVERHDPTSAPRGSIVAQHGMSESAATLRCWALRWAEAGYAVALPEQRGHGASPRWLEADFDRHPGDVIAEDLVHAVRQIADTLPRPIVLFGHSSGGGAAAAAATSLTDIISGVVLEDPFWRLPVTAFQDPEVAESALGWLQRQQSLDHDARVAEARREHPQWAEEELAEWSHSKAQVDPQIVANGHVIASTPWPAILEQLRASDIPVLIITGTDRIGITPEHAAIAQARGAVVHRIQGASHFVRRDRPEEFDRVFGAFLDRVCGRASSQRDGAHSA